MKKITHTTLFFLLVFGNLFAQQEKGIFGYNNWLDAWTDFVPNRANYEEPTQILTGNISGKYDAYQKKHLLTFGRCLRNRQYHTDH